MKKEEMKMNLIAIRAPGRIGSRLIARLMERGHSVHMLIRNPGKAHLSKNSCFHVSASFKLKTSRPFNTTMIL
jgi:putative NADH-flavin reductase